MKKILTISLLAMAFALPSAAQQMMVEKDGAENEVISLDKLKRITFDGKTVNIEQTDGNRSSATMGNISRIYFGDFTSIGDIDRKESLVTYITDEEIAVNCTAGAVVTIYSITGTQILSTRLDTDGGRINIAGIPQGIYIIKADDRTAKFVRR